MGTYLNHTIFLDWKEYLIKYLENNFEIPNGK